MNIEKLIKIKDVNGNEKEGELLLYFDLEATKKDYLLYTFNERDEHNHVKIYASEMQVDNGVHKFVGIQTDDEWTQIKEIIKELGKEGKENEQQI